jgi:hypothetical protein
MRTPLVAMRLTREDPNGASSARWVRAVLVAIVLAASLGAPREARCTCREAAPGDAEAKVRWVRAGALEDTASLDRWCAAVGGPLLMGSETSPTSASVVDGLAVVVWNVHVGNAALERLVAELRAGKLSDGRPAEHFVLLLQEAVRVGSAIPDAFPPGALSARAVAAPVDPSRSIDALAARATGGTRSCRRSSSWTPWRSSFLTRDSVGSPCRRAFRSR